MTGQQLKQLRKGKSLSLREASERLGVSITTLARWERSENIPNWDQCMEIMSWQTAMPNLPDCEASQVFVV